MPPTWRTRPASPQPGQRPGYVLHRAGEGAGQLIDVGRRPGAGQRRGSSDACAAGLSLRRGAARRCRALRRGAVRWGGQGLEAPAAAPRAPPGRPPRRRRSGRRARSARPRPKRPAAPVLDQLVAAPG